MFAVDFSTFIAAITVLVSIIFFLIVFKSKPSKNQVLEMKEIGAEIVAQIQKCVKQFEEEKIQLEQKIEEMKSIHESAYGIPNPTTHKKPELVVKKKSNSEIVRMHRDGHSIEEIARMLNVQRGIIEVSLNFENLDAR